MPVFKTRRTVEFADSDMGGVVHFSRYLVFMETAEHQFLEALGSCVMLKLDGRHIGWPRVSATCEYRSPARFGDRIEIRVRVRRKGRSSMTYEFRFTRDGDELAVGRMTSVCCVLEPDEVRSIPIPASIADRVREHE